ncbi:Uncharacterised protein [Mycoplasmopsis californica]|uniref:Uncharacterized protein n=1 Tax=Mycoplasmopsis equigenitalium TaxID=114883 RepID=A0ABY5J5J0_9BACT|nr:hypothetical protein [Mycoplasmopsis equigenitalium]UUD36953.1 hypothetical protein NPA09_03575 [Mycoplasmopsis equigenitalium]VEU69752.1 Uncharacterised protein [Mycoplasmopsis californica]
MKTMVDIALEHLNAHGEDKFENIFVSIKNEFLERWQHESEKNNTPIEETLTKKMGELYKLLTVDAKFTYLGDNRWDVAYRENETRK